MENKNEFVDIKINKEIYEILKLWNKERKEDLKNLNNQCTRNPIYKVQKNTWTTATSEDFEKEEIMVDCETFLTLEQVKEGELDRHIEYNSPCSDKEVMEIIKNIKECYSLEDVLDILEENEIPLYQDEIVYSKEDWEDQAYFLTHREAKEYMQYQKHNLRQCRIYVDAPGYDNRGTLDKFLQIIDFEDIFEVIK